MVKSFQVFNKNNRSYKWTVLLLTLREPFFSKLSKLNPSNRIAIAIFEIKVNSNAPAEKIMTAVRISVSEGT
jgi:hypothetical protein